MPDGAYEGRFFAGLAADVRDYLHKNSGRANARHGFLLPPTGRGRVIWIKVDGSEGANALAGEIASAVRERRQDVRLVVTFEQEYPQLVTRLSALPRTGYGFGPRDTRRATERTLRRLEPAGVVIVGQGLRPRLGQLLEAARIPCCLVHGVPPRSDCGCFGFPNTLHEKMAWGSGRDQHEGALASLTAVAQVEPVFQGIAGAHAKALFWYADPSPEEARQIAEAFGASLLGTECLLFLGVKTPAAVVLSEWDQKRVPLTRGSVVWVDDERFWPALAASCLATHIRAPSERLLWAVMAGGRVVTAQDPGALDLVRPAPLPVVSPGTLLPYWQGLLAEPLAARGRADDLRRFFWSERRRAGLAAEALFQRVYDW